LDTNSPSLPVVGPSGRKLTSSQKSGVKCTNPNVSPYLAAALFEKCSHFSYTVFICILWMSNEQFYIKSYILWDITPCSPFKVNRCFGVTNHLHLEGGRISQPRNQHKAGRKQSNFM
jgi:hypothetical protein